MKRRPALIAVLLVLAGAIAVSLGVSGYDVRAGLITAGVLTVGAGLLLVDVG